MISRYRPRLPSVSTSLLSMDMLPIVTVFRSTSSGHHSPSLEWSLGAHSVGTSSGRPFFFFQWRCRTDELSLANVRTHPTSDTQNRQGSSLRDAFSHWVQTSVRFVPKDPRAAKRQNPNNQKMETLRLDGLHCEVSETSRNAPLYHLKSLSS